MLSKNIAAARKAKGLSQKQLAAQLNVTRVAVYNWEVNSCQPTLANLRALAKKLDTTVDALLARRWPAAA